MTSRAKIGWGVAAAVALVAAAVVFRLSRPDGREDRPGTGDPRAEIDPDTYRSAVSAFSQGVAALDADATAHAKKELTKVTELAPDEPAAWINLGLAEIRLSEDEDAVKALERAKSLAPDDATPDRLLGLLESRRGRPAEAIGHLRRAVEKDPDDVRSMFALADEIERQNDEGSEAEVRRLIEEIVKRRPENVPALMHLARLAVKANDGDAIRDVVAKLRPLSAAWPDRAKDQFRQVEEAVSGGNLRQAAPRVTVLRNLLIAEPAFRASLAEIQPPQGTVGEPVEQFLKLPPPAPTPSPADTGLTFAAQPFDGADTPAAALVALPAVKDGPPTIFAADGKAVRLIGADRTPLAFPGGDQETPPGPHGLLAVDWNGDAAIDLVCAGAGGLRLYRQEADGSFADVTEATTLDAGLLNAATAAVWTADVELDGDLDLITGPEAGPPAVLRNNGDGTFAPLRPFDDVAGARSFVWSDLNGDGLPDIVFLDGSGKAHVCTNERSGRYGRRPLPETAGELRAITSGDLDGDGGIDLVALRADGKITRFSAESTGSGWRTAEVAPWDGTPPAGVRLLLADLDNNGALDLVGSSKTETRVWLGGGSGQLRALPATAAVQTASVLDLDGDGKLDLAGLSDRGAPVRAMNRATKSYHWQAIRPRAAKVVGDGRINSFGLGGEIEVRAGLLVQRQVIASPTVHFGLGDRPDSDLARIVWPNGTIQAEFDTKIDQVLTAEQRLKGSCPFVYAHDGKAVRFVTDFLWRSPLGLRINAQDTAGVSQTEDWIKIRGDQLAPRDGRYDVRITAELWETHYFDHVSLMVVDHPAGTEVFADERFARTPPALKVHATGPLVPVTASDDNDQDVTEIVRAADGRYLDTFGRGPYQGVTRDHWVQVEIPDAAPRDRPLRLIARGWVHPTDSSINVALSQGRHAPPQGLALEVPDADGGWTTARPDLGFPAGKDKTVVIDLDGLFPKDGPRKLRLRTNLEVFWDQLAVAAAEDENAVRSQRLDAESAELRHRGYSLMTQADPGSPELPHYDVLTGTAQRWRDLEGFYTRYGDVRELLRETDDRYVIANAGDEVLLSFPAPAAPPAGWTRDFVLIGDGWNKDGDFNTAYSGTVLPLPSHDSTNYDAPPGALEDDPVYRRHPEDWRTYHTRYVAADAFRNGLRPARPER